MQRLGTFFLAITFTVMINSLSFASEHEETAFREGLAALQRKEFSLAQQKFRIAAQAGHALAQYQLGRLNDLGQVSTGQDFVQAVHWYQLAAAQAVPEAQSRLAELLLEGRGIEANPKRAYSLLLEAAQAGLEKAQTDLGDLYYAGQVIARDYEQALLWYERAALQNNSHAQFMTGVLYADGLGGVKQDFRRAADWYRQAAEQGEARAAYRLAWLYLEGHGVLIDEAEATIWLRRAANAGHPSAQFDLANLYYEGKGVTQDRFQAYEWYLKSALQGYARAWQSLGYLHEKGEGTQQNLSKAYQWYWLAAQHKVPGADLTLQAVGRQLTPEAQQLAMQAAQRWLNEHPEAQPKPRQ